MNTLLAHLAFNANQEVWDWPQIHQAYATRHWHQ